MRNVRKLSILCCCLIVATGFTVFAPIISLGADVSAVGGFAITVQTHSTSTAGMGSIALCYFGQGAVLVQGMYYPLTNPTQVEGTSSCPALRASHK